MAIRFGAAGQGEKFFLEFARDGAGDAFADLNVVHGTNRRNFHGGAYEENFVHDVEHFARDDGFLDGNAEIFRHFHDGVASDAGKNAGSKRRSEKSAVVYQEDVHAGAFTDVAARIERNAFRIAIEAGFHANELRVHVIRGGFGHGGQRVRSDARPGANTDVHALREGFGAEIRAPGPASHVAINGRVERVHADFAVAAKNDGLDVTGVEFVVANEFARDVGEIVHGMREIHAIDFRGVDEALHVFAKAENGRPLLGFVAADALENGGAVAHDVG